MINWSRSFLRTPALHYIVSWPPYTSMWSDLHLIACSFLLLLRPGSYFWWLQLQRRGGLTGVCVAAVSQPGAHSMKCPWSGSIRIQSPQAEVFVEPWLAVVETVRKVIPKNGKSWGIYGKLQVTMEWMTVDLYVLLMIYPTADSYRLKWIQTDPQFTVSLSDVVCSFTAIHWRERQLKSHVW